MKKSIIHIICFLSLLFSYTSCSQNNKPSDQLNLEPISVNNEKVHKAYFASPFTNFKGLIANPGLYEKAPNCSVPP